MKSKVFFVLFLCVTVVTVFGAGGQQAGGTESRTVSLSMSQVRYGYSVNDAMMRAWADGIERATNTTITLDPLPHNDFNTHLNVRFASGDYSDIIRPQQAWDVVSQFAARGFLQPVTQIINTDSRFAAVRGIDLPYKFGDDIYGIPTAVGNNKIYWFREDLAQRYGINTSETMTTTQFVNELRKVDRNQHIPFSFPRFLVNLQIFYNPFGALAGITRNASGEYIDGMQTPEMREALLYVRSLYEEGLMDREFITNDNVIMREKFFSGRAASIMDYTYRYPFFINSSAAANVPTGFIPVYTLTGPRGDAGNLNEAYGEAMTISSRNRSVAASLDIIHWLFFTDAGRRHDSLGVEGVHYDIVNRTLIPRPDAVSTGYAIEHHRLSNSWVQVPFESLGFSFEDMTDSVISNMLRFTELAFSPRYIGPMIKVPMGLSQRFDENVASYTANLEEMAARVIMGTQTIDQAYADYARFWASINGDAMLAQLNATRR